MKIFTGNAKFLSLLLVAGLILSFSRATAQNIQINNGKTQTRITQNTYQALALDNGVSAVNVFTVKTDDGDFSQLRINGYGYSNNIGEPRLPVMKKLIEVPLDASFDVNITYQSYKEYNLSDYGVNQPVFPAQPSLSKSDNPDQVPFEYNKDVYAMDGLLGNDLVKVYPLGIMRGLRIARLEISPVQYNPVKNMIRVYDNLSVEITFTGGDVAQTIQLKASHANPYFRGIGKELFNYKDLESTDELFSETPITYIIVSDPMFEEALQPFVEWKSRKGFNVVEAYTDNPEVGTTTTSIKNYLKDFYENPPQGYNPQTFVLIVGDVDQIPAFTGNAGGHVTDLYYCEYTNDLFPEAYYGRFSANNLDELQPQIDKTLEYEQYTFPDPSFLDEVVMSAGADASHQSTWGNGQINYGTENYFNEAHGLTSHTYLQPEPAGGNYAENIHQNVSDGVSYANYTAHCSPSGWADPSFVISDISGLTNAHKYPLMVGNCCSSVEFQTTCFGEEMLRAPLKGAIGYIGGSNSTYWDEDFWWGVGFETISANPPYNAENLGAYDRTFHDKSGQTTDDWYITQGQMVSAGNLAVSQSGSSREEYYWEIYHLMGDPSVMIYFSQPPDVTATYAGLMPLGSATFTVNTDPYAYVAISKDGVLHGAALADADGLAEITFTEPITVPGDADVIITGQNLKPYFGTVAVASPDGPYVLLDEFTINDNNGMMEYGETLNIGVSMKNLGQDTGNNVELTLTTDDDYVTIDNATATLGNIDPEQVITIDDAFGITVAEDIPDGHNVSFNVEASDGTDSWTSNFSVKGHAPVLEYNSFMISDASGNNNGKIDPGESVTITVYVNNTGSADAYNVMGSLSTSSTYLTVNTTEPQAYGNVTAEGTASATFDVDADAATPAGQIAELNADFSADMGISANGTFNVVIGQIPVLVLDLDENHNSASYIKDAVDAQGVASEIMTEFPEDLNLYSSIFVCLGIYSDNYALTSDEGQRLADYLDNGGALYMEGGDTWAFDDQTAVHPMFGINGTDDGDGDLGTIEGVDGTFTEGMSYDYTGDNNWIDHLETVGNAQAIFNNNSPAYTCGIMNDPGTYKTVGVSFEYGGITDENTRGTLMEAYLEFFGIIGNSSILTCNATASPAEICAGDFSQLNVQVNGGSGSYEFVWSPETGLSDPTAQNPMASPETTTTYTVTVTDGLTASIITDQVNLVVNPAPETPEINQMGANLVSSAETGNQWYDDNGAITGATGQIYTPSVTGNYYTIVTNTYGCISESSNVIYFQPTFIEELGKDGSFRIYPNPAKDIVTIDFIANNTDQVRITVHNAFGQTLHEMVRENQNRGMVNSISFDMSSLQAGVYYIRLQNKNNTVTKKIILSK